MLLNSSSVLFLAFPGPVPEAALALLEGRLASLRKVLKTDQYPAEAFPLKYPEGESASFHKVIPGNAHLQSAAPLPHPGKTPDHILHPPGSSSLTAYSDLPSSRPHAVAMQCLPVCWS